MPGSFLPRDGRRTSPLIWTLAIICAILAIAVIVAGLAVFVVYIIYQPKMPYIKVADARLDSLLYEPSGLLELEMELDLVAENDNNKAFASFSDLNFLLQFHDIDVAVLKADALDVPRNSSAELNYHFQSRTIPLDQAAMEAMDAALKRDVVPFDLSGHARTRWKAGIFLSVRFWTRLSCELHFFYSNRSAVEVGCISKLH